MKKTLLVIAFLLASVFVKAQTSNWLWAITSSGTSYEYCYGLFVDTGGHLFTSGRIGYSGAFGGISYNPGGLIPYVGKFDTSNTGIWLATGAFSGFDYCEGFSIDNHDNSYVTGIAGSGMLIGKYDKYGVSKWSPVINGPNPAGLGIAADNTGAVYVAGTTNGTFTMGPVTLNYSGSGQAIFVAKLDSNGNCTWGRTMYGTGAFDGIDQARDIVVDNKGYIYFIGDYFGAPNFGGYTVPTQTGSVQNFFIAKYDTAGNEIWVTTSTNSFGCDFGGSVGLALDSCDDIYVTGEFENTAQFGSNFSYNSQGGEDAFVAKLDNNGNWQWVSAIGSAGRDAGFSICTDKHNEVFVGGDYGGTANLGNGVTLTGSGGGFVAKFANSTGQVLWALGGIGSITGHVYGMAVDRSGYAYASGDYSGSASFGTHTINGSGAPSNCFIAKLDTVDPRVIIPDLNSTYCSGISTSLPFSIVGSFNQGNVFTVQLSDSSGSFVNSTTIGTDTTTTGGVINITIPDTIKADSNYLIRLVSSNPATSSYVNGCGAYYQQNVYPNDFYITITGGNGGLNVSLSPVNAVTCAGSPITLKADSGNTSVTELWGNGSTADSIVVSPLRDTTYAIAIIGGCGSKDTSIAVTVRPDTTSLNPQFPTICDGSSVELSMSANGTYSWSPSTGLNKATGDTIIATPTATVTYTVTGTNSFGCAVNDSDIITVNSPITPPAIKQKGDTLISSYTQGNTWTLNDTAIATFTDSSVVITKSGWYQVTETNSVNGCSATSDSEYITGLNQLAIPSNALSIYPNPASGTINVSIKVTAHELQNLSLQLTDVLGRTIYTRSSLNYTNEIDLSQLASGVYFVSVINKNGRTVLPVIKQ